MIRFVGTRGGEARVGLDEAIEGGSAPDGGLWVPDPLPEFGATPRLDGRDPVPFVNVATGAALPWLAFLGRREATALLLDVLHIPVSLRPLGEDVDRLDLTRGPSAAFKDVGARFLAGLWQAIPRSDRRARTVLVATSGDTGGAVAEAVRGRPGLRALILFPAGRVSDVQRRQFTTVGGNVRAVAIDGAFDDAQRMVRELFEDREATERHALVSANSINPGRLLPQTLYYLYLALLLEAREGEDGSRRPVIVPSGNVGNVTAAVWARRMGAALGPIHAAVNENDALVRALEGRDPPAGGALRTDSTAMDVGSPSNLERLRWMAEREGGDLRDLLHATSIPVEEAREAQREAARDGVLIDPHTAVGLALATRLRSSDPKVRPVVVETAHPAKFPDVMERVTGHRPDPPPPLRARAAAEERYRTIPGTRDALLAEIEAL